jgi:hypothetical protein
MTSDNPFATLIDTDALEWIETPGGNALKPLWVSEETGAWSALIKAKGVYEPAGAVHEATSHPEDTVYLANVRGPIAYHGPDGKVTHVSNADTMKKALANRK